MNKDTKDTVIKFEDIDNCEIDEAANKYPMLTEYEHNRLVEDIKANGQQQPVVIFENRIIDGRNRLKAVKELKRDLIATVITTTYEDALKLAYSNNDKRRHMSKSQFAMKAAFTILASRKNEDGTPKPKTKWLKVKKVQEVEDNVVSKRNVDTALNIASDVLGKEIANKVFDGVIELSDAQKELVMIKAVEKGEVVDTSPRLFEGNKAAVEKYNTYTAKGKYKLIDLAKMLVEAEIRLGELSNQKSSK